MAQIREELKNNTIDEIDYETSAGLLEKLFGFKKALEEGTPIMDIFSIEDLISFEKIREALGTDGDLGEAIDESIEEVKSDLKISLADLFKELGVEDDQIEGLVDTVADGMIQSFEGASEAIEETTKNLKEMSDAFRNLDNIEKIEEAIGKINASTMPDYSSISSLVQLYPELLQYLGNEIQ